MISCFHLANENAGNLISVVQFLIILSIESKKKQVSRNAEEVPGKGQV